jgi:hypothetical protein
MGWIFHVWPPDYESAAKAEHQKARWPEGTAADFEHKLDAVKIYWPFRWPGDRPEWTTKEEDLLITKIKDENLNSGFRLA